MFFNFFNILTSFEKDISNILAKKLNIFVTIYLNNILIYIKNLNQSNIKIIY